MLKPDLFFVQHRGSKMQSVIRASNVITCRTF